MTIKLLGHLAEEVLASKRPTRVCAGTQRFVRLVPCSVEKRFPIGVRLLSPPIHVQEAAFIVAGDVGRGARPTVIAGSRGDSGPYGVALHIRQRRPKMVRRQDAGEETILPQMSGPSRAGVVILGVAPVNAPQEHAQGVLGGWHGDEMNVVGHQTPAQHADAGIGQVLLQQAEVVCRSASLENVSRRSTPRWVMWQGTPGNTQRFRRGIMLLSMAQPYESRKKNSPSSGCPRFSPFFPPRLSPVNGDLGTTMNAVQFGAFVFLHELTHVT